PAVIIVGRTAAEGFLGAPVPVPAQGAGREALVPEAVAQTAPGSPAPVLLGCSHGTRSREGRDVIRGLLRRIARHAPGGVREAFVDVQSPDIAEVVSAHAEAAETRTRESAEVQAVVVPLLLSLGHHVKDDIAGAVAGRAAVAAAPLGPEPRLAGVMAQRLAETGPRPGDAVVEAGLGPRDPGSRGGRAGPDDGPPARLQARPRGRTGLRLRREPERRGGRRVGARAAAQRGAARHPGRDRELCAGARALPRPRARGGRR